MLPANFTVLCVAEANLLPSEVLYCGNRDFLLFCSCDLDLDTMTFIYELDPYSLKIYQMSENELPTSRLSKVIVWHTYIHTHRQKDRQTEPKSYITPLRGWSNLLNLSSLDDTNVTVGFSGVASYGAPGHVPPPSTSKYQSKLSKYCVVCEISWCRCQQLTALLISTALVTKLLVIDQLMHPALKSTVSAPWHNLSLCPSLQQILATPLVGLSVRASPVTC